jgi:rhomboid-like protein
MKMPDARLGIVFLPMFTFSAQSAVVGIVLFDLAGLIFRFRLFDHAAHLGGAICGILYAKYGEEYIRKHFYPLIIRNYLRLTGRTV